jgi:pantoate--beta-alanine ligase
VAVEKLHAEVVYLISERPDAKIDYIEFFDPKTLQPVSKVARGHQVAMAVRVGTTRLIDNGNL